MTNPMKDVRRRATARELGEQLRREGLDVELQEPHQHEYYDDALDLIGTDLQDEQGNFIAHVSTTDGPAPLRQRLREVIYTVLDGDRELTLTEITHEIQDRDVPCGERDLRTALRDVAEVHRVYRGHGKPCYLYRLKSHR